MIILAFRVFFSPWWVFVLLESVLSKKRAISMRGRELDRAGGMRHSSSALYLRERGVSGAIHPYPQLFLCRVPLRRVGITEQVQAELGPSPPG